MVQKMGHTIAEQLIKIAEDVSSLIKDVNKIYNTVIT